MIQSLEVSNFKGFKSLKLRNLSRVNILVGDNGSGKTALLESLFMTGGLGPEIYLRTRAWRGQGELLQVNLDRDSYEALWKELFRDLEQDRPVLIKFADSEAGERSLRIYYEPEETNLLPMNMRSQTNYESWDVHPITFEWTAKGKVHKLTCGFNQQGIMQIPTFSDFYPMVFLSSSTFFLPGDNVRRFSALSRKKQQGRALEIIKKIYPVVDDISVEIVAGMYGLYSSAENLPEKISVGSLSSGLSKYMAIMFAIASLPSGVVIVDEIENGFFYSRYGQIWAGITELAEETKAQLFISTHSIECLQAAFPEVSKNPSLFSLLRTERKNNICVVKQFSGKDFQAAIEQKTEFR
ncbi:MAG: AAA family ATPase [Desulfomonilaceae bacterium]